MRKSLVVILSVAFAFSTSVSAFAAGNGQVSMVSTESTLTAEELIDWCLDEYSGVQVVKDATVNGVVEDNPSDIVAVGSRVASSGDTLLRAATNYTWTAYHGNNSSGKPYGRLKINQSVKQCIYGLIDYKSGGYGTVLHNENEVTSADHTHTINTLANSGYSTMYYYIQQSQVHQSTSPMWFSY